MESVFVNPVVKIFHLVPGSAAQASADEEAVHLKVRTKILGLREISK